MLFLDATHHHAQMPGLDDHAYALWLDGVLDRLRNLRGQPLLDLQAARERFDEARYFAQADHFSVGDVGHVDLAKKRQKVVLAQAEHFDVFHDHHLVVGGAGEGGWFRRRFHRFLVVSRWSIVVGELYPQTTNDNRLTIVFSRVLKRI